MQHSHPNSLNSPIVHILAVLLLELLKAFNGITNLSKRQKARVM